ncbi:MAG: hypothetical protein AAFR58_07145 [Cyanobacteria bacterium J06627_28]
MPKLTPLLIAFGLILSVCGVLVSTFLQGRSSDSSNVIPATFADALFNQASADEISSERMADDRMLNATAADRLRHPPLVQTFSAGAYRLVVAATDSWETPNAVAEFYDGDMLRWQTPLSQQYGPRFALVTARGETAGTVLMVDDFINVASESAIALFNPQGILIAQYSFDDIQQILDIPPAEIADKATSGWWVSSSPTLSQDEDTAYILTGGTRLDIDLITGELNLPTMR